MILLLLACLPKTAPVQAPTGTQLRWVHWMVTEQGIEPLPKSVLEDVQRAFAERGITVTEQGEPSGRARLSKLPPEDRLDESGPMAVVACEPQFDTQVNGRFRWRIECDVNVGTDSHPHDRHVNAVAHPVYYHQREAVALEEAAPAVRREVGRALDAWLTASAAALDGN